jgi:hypothetical protein
VTTCSHHPELTTHAHTSAEHNMMINFDGIADNLAFTIANELNLFRGRREDFESARTLLTDFCESHPEAERAVSRLVLKHLGISRSVLRPSRHAISASESGWSSDNGEDVYAENPRDHGSQCLALEHEDLIPPLSPIPWLSQPAWEAMDLTEKVDLMEMAILGLSHPSASIRYRFYPFTSQYRDSFVMFGRGCVDRVVLGSGPRHVLVLVGIHGNEACGVEAARLMLQRHSLFIPPRRQTLATNKCLGDDSMWSFPLDTLFQEMTIEFIVGNPRAVEANKRFLERKLNRLLDVHVLCEDGIGVASYEVQRARVLVEAIRHSDVVLDIHSVSSESDPFALPSSMDASEELACQLPVSYVVQSLANCTAEGGTTMDCALLHGVPGVCVECGQHHHPDIVARAADVISTFLVSQCGDGYVNNDIQDDVGKGKGPIVMRCEGIEIVRDGFEFLQPFKEFEFVTYGTPVFKDEQGEVCCPVEPGAYLVMPAKTPVVGEEALSWARAVET